MKMGRGAVRRGCSITRRALRALGRIGESGCLHLAVLFRSVKGPTVGAASRGKGSRFGKRTLRDRGVTHAILGQLGFSGRAVHVMAGLIYCRSCQVRTAPTGMHHTVGQVNIRLFPCCLTIHLTSTGSRDACVEERGVRGVMRVEGLCGRVLVRGRYIALQRLTIDKERLVRLKVGPKHRLNTVLDRLLRCILSSPRQGAGRGLYGCIGRGVRGRG